MNRFRIASTVLLATFLASPASAQSPRALPKRFALLAGINRYEERAFAGSPLQYAERDVEELGNELSDQGFKVELLKGSSEGKSKATGANILKALDAILAEAKASDVVLIALTGHGNQVELKGADGKPLKDAAGKPQEDILFHPVDATKTSDLRYEKSISVSAILEKLDADGGINLVLLDACRDTPVDTTRGARAVSGNDWRQALPQNTAVLFACSAKQRAWETEKAGGGHGVFMQTVLEGLRGAAAKNDRVSWKSLEAHVIESTNDAAIKLIAPADLKAGEELQTPHSISNIASNPILVDLSGRKPVTPSALPFNFADKAKTAAEARSAQEAWAKKLGVEVVETNSLGMQMVLIPPGEFMMGSTPSEIEAYLKQWPTTERKDYEDEQPQNRVRLTKAFRMAAHEVTVAQFRAFADAMDYKTDAEKKSFSIKGGDYGARFFPAKSWNIHRNISGELSSPLFDWRSELVVPRGAADRHPVVYISHNDAVAFVNWLNEKEHTKKYRLPSEAMWEYACRAGTTTFYQSGDDSEGLAKVGNVADRTGKELFAWKDSDLIVSHDGYAETAPVGQFRSNHFGLFDLHGNALEWLSDAYDDKAYEKAAESRRIDPEVVQDLATTKYFVLRGGSWKTSQSGARSGYRDRGEPDFRACNMGFRLASSE